MSTSSEPDLNVAVREMFDAISPRYDLLNRLLSASLDRSWRNRAVALLPPAGRVLDLCAGTGDLSLVLRRRMGPEAAVVSADFSRRMLLLALPKVAGALGQGGGVVQADARSLPWPARSYDAVAVAFGIRNVYPPAAGLREIARVLRPGGHLLVLEFFGPRQGYLRPLFSLYFRHLLPRLGRLVSGDSQAYRYLPESVARFADRQEFARLLAEAGLRQVQSLELSGGIATAILARREGE